MAYGSEHEGGPRGGGSEDGAEIGAPGPAAAAGAPDSADAVRAELLRRGWLQGSVLPPELAARVVMIPGADVPPADGNWFIVVSQDCDIVYGHCDVDPAAEVVLATPITKTSARREDLRDARELHVHLTEGDGGAVHPVAIHVRNRGFLDRKLLLDYDPATIRADGDAMRRIAVFLARRYTRSARPEEFDQRFRPALRKLETLLENEVDALLDVLLHIDPTTELPDGEPYELTLYAVLQDEFDDRPRAQTKAKRAEIASEIRRALKKCNGIQWDEPRVLGRYDINIRERSDLMSLDFAAAQFVPRAGQGGGQDVPPADERRSLPEGV